jgi:NAD-dependent SIR2 family protein deacetylase
MATYHGLIKLECLACRWITEDDSTIEVMNDLVGECPDCNMAFFRWENQDGSIVVSLRKEGVDGEEVYDNLVLKGDQ